MLSNTPGKKLNIPVRNYVVFDLETTGISPMRDKVIELSAIKVEDGQITDEFSTLVDPGMHIPYGATMVNNITDDMVAGAPDFRTVLESFDGFIGNMVLVGHNIAAFDMKFICRDAMDYFGLTIGNDYIDTLPLSRRCLPELRHHTLVDLAGYYGISSVGAHRALNDCRMNREVYERLVSAPAPKPASAGPVCPRCGAAMKKRSGRFGIFWGCTAYPECRYTINI